MKKRLRFYYRYIIRSRRLRNLLSLQSLMIAALSLVVLTALLVALPDAPSQVEPTITPLFTLTPDPNAGPTRTPLPPEYLENSRVTIGITFGAAVLVLIVIFGVMSYMPKNSE
jgi:hypothetical protein